VRFVLSGKFVLAQQLLTRFLYVLEGELQYISIVRWKKFHLFPTFRCGKNPRKLRDFFCLWSVMGSI